MEEWTIGDLQQQMASGEATAQSLTQAYLERIAQVDHSGPNLRSVIETNPDALLIAATCDAERAAGNVRGPLHGVPILIKDNIATHDHMATSAGSLALAESIAPRDAFVVSRLRAAGAVIIGKTNLSEWANFRGYRSISGWSSRGGLTRNPYALDRSACGSSSGSGAAVAANLCAAAVGTETDGSIICPSQTNGIVGIKPTLGLVSRSGIIPISASQDTAGPMARTVADAAALLSALAGSDPDDHATRRSSKRGARDYTQFLDPEALKGTRIGVARGLAGNNQRILAVFEACIDTLKQLGAEIIDPVELAVSQALSDAESTVLHYELKDGLNSYLAGLGSDAPARSLADIIAFNEAHRAEVMPYFGQEHMTQAEETDSLDSKKYRKALEKSRHGARKRIDKALEAHELDAIVTPSGGPSWLIDLVNGDAINWGIHSTSLPAISGYPHITVPAGYVGGLPVGLSFIAGAWQEPTLIALAYAFEQATRVRVAPQFHPSALV